MAKIANMSGKTGLFLDKDDVRMLGGLLIFSRVRITELLSSDGKGSHRSNVPTITKLLCSCENLENYCAKILMPAIRESIYKSVTTLLDQRGQHTIA